MLLNSGAIAQASNASLKALLLDLTHPFGSPHIFKGGRKEKFSKTPEIKYFLFPFMYLVIRGGLGERIWDRFWITTDLHITENLSANTLWKHAKSSELKAILIKCTGMFSYISNPTPILNYTWKLFCDFLWRSTSLKESKEFLHTEFWFPMFFFTTLAQSGGLAISLARDLCCLTSYCFWVKWETWFWIFFSFCEMAHCLGTCIYRALGIIPYLSHYYFSFCATHSSKVTCNIADNWGKGKEERNIDNGYL